MENNHNTSPPDLEEVFGNLSKQIDNCLFSISNANPYIVFVALIGMAIWFHLGGGFIIEFGDSAKAAWSDNAENQSHIQIIVESVSIVLTLLAYCFLIASGRNARNKGYIKLSERLESARVLVYLVLLFGVSKIGILGFDGYNGVNLYSDLSSFYGTYKLLTLLFGGVLMLRLILFTLSLGDEVYLKQVATQKLPRSTRNSRFSNANQASKIKRRTSPHRL